MGTSTDNTAEGHVPENLKARFKQMCASQPSHLHRSWQVRVHRSLSWFKRANQFGDEQPEAKFLFLWIALNSLYSRWNAERNAPDLDSPSRRDFLHHVCGMDKPTIAALLQKSRGLVKKLLSDPFLAEVFWRDATHPKAKGWATEDANFIDRNLKAGEVGKILNQIMDRLFLLRGQIVHGASSGGSRLNRKSLNYCLQMLETIVPLIQGVVIENGQSVDWPELCYPPT